MPRGPRLDAPGVLHHVMVRGMEGRALFRDDQDYQAWVDRLAAVAEASRLTVLAWACLPNHAHGLLRTGSVPVATAMRRLLTGYAGSFNRRHRRRGHLFQNRYKSILVEEEPYLLELVRYIHLNPLRAGLVKDLEALDRYPWAGHSALLGRVPRPWQAVDEVLGQFGRRPREARRRYRAFVAVGIPLGRRPELQGGGLRRSAGGWEALAALRRGREHGLADERILGSGAFVAAVHRALPPPADALPRPAGLALLGPLLARCTRAWGILPVEVQAANRRRPVAQVRAVLSYLGTQHLGLAQTTLAQSLGVTPAAVHLGIGRGPGILAARGLRVENLLPPSRKYYIK